MKNIFLITILAVFYSFPAFSQSFKIIVNASNEVSSLSQKEVSDYFMKKKTKWPSGIAVAPVDQSSSSKVREQFSQQIHGKSTGAIRNYWQQAAFSGSGTAPTEKASDSDVIEYVKKTPGAIGYISADANVSGVKVISVN